MLGFINLFKPAGLTSTQAVSRVRRILRIASGDRRLPAGHLGTLDPQAAGVLPIAVGKATRLIPLLDDRRKAYACTFVAGIATDTQDAVGRTIASQPVPANWAQALPAALESFVGRIEQTPPMFSALHHGGKRLYELAREGVVVERKARTITIYSLQLLGVESINVARIRIACSEGTYIRTLCSDIGERIGLPAHMGSLVREASGPFVLSEALTMEAIAADPLAALIAPENIVPFPTIVLDLRESADFRAGRMVPLPAGVGSRHVFVRDESRTLVGVGETLGALLAPRKVFI
jgi:tRNA pseudouridine55 synthase